tara:strand:+ start:129 stop:386 length:258 start_codon:yes stop_codon:yes gene_type:complete
MSPKKYDAAYRKNYAKLVRENRAKLGPSGPPPGAESYKKLVDQAVKETNKELGYTQTQAIKFQQSILKEESKRLKKQREHARKKK